MASIAPFSEDILFEVETDESDVALAVVPYLSAEGRLLSIPELSLKVKSCSLLLKKKH